MKIRPDLAVLALLAGLMMHFSATAIEPREVSWDDLVPPEAQWDDPFTKLDESQLYDLSMVSEMRKDIEAGKNISAYTLSGHEKRIQDLQEQGVDIDGLLAIADKVAEERTAKVFLANQSLNGASVRIPGYLLPLEFDGDKVTEFFLVPYVGACIHTPPPQPNQIVHVKTDDGYPTDGGLYTPVWVTGTMKLERRESSLNYVDGAADIPSAYALDAISVKPYE